MNKLSIFIFFLILISFKCSISFGQKSFSYLVSTPDDERIFDGVEDELGNYYMVGRKYKTEPISEPAYLLVLNSDGQLVYEHEFYSEDTLSYFSNVYYKNDSIIIFGAKGSTASGLKDELWMLVLDGDFNVLKSKTYKIDGYSIGGIESIINRKGNYVISCNVVLPQPLLETDLFFYEISDSGDSVNQAILPLEGREMGFDLIENTNGGYKVFAYGNFPGAPNTSGTIVEFDSLFNYISADSIPYGLMFNHSARWLNDSFYLVTGYKPIHNPIRDDLGIIKLNADDDFIIGNHFGKTGDTTSYVGACSNLDFISPDDIFFGGASNIVPAQGLFQTEDSWLLLNNLDSNLNLNWQKFYGGDAAYYLWGLKATQDGGCLLMATRYDADIQDHEMDIFILKVDSNGLLTSTGDEPLIPVQQLVIFPNPASDFITIRYPDIFGNNLKEIIILNTHGSEVKHIPASRDGTETGVNVSDLPAGFYLAMMKIEGKNIATGKFVLR